MPALRNVRRSRRLSNKPPRDAVFEDPDDFNLHDDRQSTPSRESDSPEPDAGSVRKGLNLKDPCTPQGDALPLGVDFEFVRRSSHSRKRDPNHIPRPPNAFMFFRSDFWAKEKNKLTVERDHRMISRNAGLEWNRLSEAQRAPYRSMAERAKQQHALRYPGYKYTPVFRKEKTHRRKGTKRYAGVARPMPEGYDSESEDIEDSLPMRAPHPRKPTSRARAKKSRAASRPPTPETRSPSPGSSVTDDYVKSEPSTPELTFSPELAKAEIDDSPYISSQGLAMDEMEIDPQVLSLPPHGLSFPLKQWFDDPPSTLNFTYVPGGDSFISDPFSDATMAVAVHNSHNDYLGSSEAVDDAFAISPMFNPDRSSSFMDVDMPLYDSHPLDGPKVEGSLDFATWIRGEA